MKENPQCSNLRFELKMASKNATCYTKLVLGGLRVTGSSQSSVRGSCRPKAVIQCLYGSERLNAPECALTPMKLK